MKLLFSLLAASSMFWVPAGPASAQASGAMDTLVTDSGVYRVPPMKDRKPQKSSYERAAPAPAVASEAAAPPRGHTDFDPASVEADRAAKAAKLAQAGRERNADVRPGRAPCVFKPIMTDAEIAVCRSN